MDFNPITYKDYLDITEDLNKLCKMLVEKLSHTKFFEEAASTHFHHAYEGGLADHCIELYFRLREVVKAEGLDISDSTCFLIAVGHDLDKIGSYRYDPNEDEYQFIPRSRGGRTHGENSFYILENYLDGLFKSYKDYELIKICILGHMGLMDRMHRAKDFWTENFSSCRLLVLTHESDAYSCQFAKDNISDGRSDLVTP